MDVERLLSIMVKRATYNAKDFFKVSKILLKDSKDKEYTQDIVELNDWDKIDGALISEIQQTKNGIKIKLPDKDKSIEMIGRHFAMFVDRKDESKQEDLTEIAKILKEDVELRNSEK